jgi:2-polyprenyl-3-methyl-5-hydroxy-6-metoxy-1,4-benzoquinol methylase
MSHQHNFILSDKEGYEICTECKSYHSIAQKPPSEIYENNYWNQPDRSTFEDQRHNLTESETCGISKVDKIMQYIPERTVLEIGAAPGELLKRLGESGYTAYGIEPDAQYIQPILNVAPLSRVIQGYFPDVFDGINMQFDYIVAMDVFEHVDEYRRFLSEIKRLLKVGGSAIIMSPIIFEDGLYRECDFKVPEQHAWIFTKEYLQEYLGAMFSSVVFDRWQNGHELFIVTK